MTTSTICFSSIKYQPNLIPEYLYIMNKIIYLDNAATTKTDEVVINAMLPYLHGDNYANPSSVHLSGLKILSEIENSRKIISDFIKCGQKELIFTSGATESLNIALKGLALNQNQNRTKFVTVLTEHKAVLEVFKYLEQIGFEVQYLGVDNDGLINLEDLKLAVDSNTIAVCAMLVNNETGVIQPVEDIVSICASNSAYFVCDASQGIGKMDVDVKKLNIDILAFSGHKIHGPKGIGALYISKNLTLEKTIHGGGQENGYRSGTLNVPGIIGLGKACEVASLNLDRNIGYIVNLRNILEKKILAIPGTRLNGHLSKRSCHIINISFSEFDANTFIRESEILRVSNGSACSSAVFEPPYVLSAMGIPKQEAFGSLRFSLSKYNTEEEIEKTVDILVQWLAKN